MNPKFFSLSEEKQQRIINAGFRIFSQNSYKKSPVSEIAEEADISKALLFHYFKNKKEFYLFLWEKSVEFTKKYMEVEKCFEDADMWVMMERGMKAKFQMMRDFPQMSAFAIRAFYEKNPDVVSEIQASYKNLYQMKTGDMLQQISPDDFVPGLNLEMMIKDMYWACEGYLWEVSQRGETDIAKMEEDMRKLLAFWKSVYARKDDSFVEA